MKWRIFYSDGSSFGYEDGEPKAAPFLGAIAVVQDDPLQFIHKCDFYWWSRNMWWGGDITGFLDQSARYGATWVKNGETLRPEDFMEINARALEVYQEYKVDEG